MNWFDLKDVDCNFLVGGDGTVYIWRGWDIEGAHTPGCNSKSICIALIGTFINQAPSKQQIDAVQKLIEEGIKRNKLIANYKLFGQRQLALTQSPGQVLYELIQKWDHWSDERNRKVLN